MKYWKLAAITSVLVNAILLVVLTKYLIVDKDENVRPTNVEIDKNYSFNTADNFRKVFIEKNDSTYKLMFNYSFENHPEDAFLVSSTYYLLTGDCKVLEDIKISNSQLESVYQTSLKVDDNFVDKCK